MIIILTALGTMPSIQFQVRPATALPSENIQSRQNKEAVGSMLLSSRTQMLHRARNARFVAVEDSDFQHWFRCRTWETPWLPYRRSLRKRRRGRRLSQHLRSGRRNDGVYIRAQYDASVLAPVAPLLRSGDESRLRRLQSRAESQHRLRRTAHCNRKVQQARRALHRCVSCTNTEGTCTMSCASVVDTRGRTSVSTGFARTNSAVRPGAMRMATLNSLQTRTWHR